MRYHFEQFRWRIQAGLLFYMRGLSDARAPWYADSAVDARRSRGRGITPAHAVRLRNTTFAVTLVHLEEHA
jgi:hypothetical protein